MDQRLSLSLLPVQTGHVILAGIPTSATEACGMMMMWLFTILCKKMNVSPLAQSVAANLLVWYFLQFLYSTLFKARAGLRPEIQLYSGVSNLSSLFDEQFPLLTPIVICIQSCCHGSWYLYFCVIC